MFDGLFQLQQKPVKVFASTDSGAPQLSLSAGSLKGIIKACLVTGYGDKPPLGWEMPFESDDKLTAVFRSADPTSSRCLIKIANTATTKADVSAYRSMTDINSGDAFRAAQPYWYNGSAGKKWMLIGHEKTFVLVLTYTYYRTSGYPLIFGDIPRSLDQINENCLLWHAWNYSGGQYLYGNICVLPDYPTGNDFTSAFGHEHGDGHGAGALNV